MGKTHKKFSLEAISETRKVLIRKYKIENIEEVYDSVINTLLNIGLESIGESDKALMGVFKNHQTGWLTEKIFERADGLWTLRKANNGSVHKKYSYRPSAQIIDLLLKKAIEKYGK